MNEMIKADEQLKSNRKRMQTMESLIMDKEEQIETLREMHKSLQEEKDLVCNLNMKICVHIFNI